jgi:hypothetical protein
MKTPRSLLGRLTLYTALGLTDLVLTCYLLQTESGWVYESNPVAQWWLVRWGWSGLAGFKLALLLLVITAVRLIGRYRPRIARHVLTFACGVTVLIVGYSCTLLGTARCQGRVITTEDEVRIQTESAQIDVQVQRMQAFYKARDQLVEDLNEGRVSLEAVVTQLAATEQVCDPDWLKSLRLAYPGHTDRERLAELVLYHARLLKEIIAEDRAAKAGAGRPDKPPTNTAGDGPKSDGQRGVGTE